MKWDNTDLRVGLMVFGALVLGTVSFVWVGRQWGRNVAPLYTDVSDVQGIGADEQPELRAGMAHAQLLERLHRVARAGSVLFQLFDVKGRLPGDGQRQQ